MLWKSVTYLIKLSFFCCSDQSVLSISISFSYKKLHFNVVLTKVGNIIVIKLFNNY